MVPLSVTTIAVPPGRKRMICAEFGRSESFSGPAKAAAMLRLMSSLPRRLIPGPITVASSA
jgi:hypothetical protein